MIDENDFHCITLHTAGYFQNSVIHAFICVLDDIRGRFICRELDVINSFFAKAALAGNLPNMVTNLVQKFKFRGELNSLHSVN